MTPVEGADAPTGLRLAVVALAVPLVAWMVVSYGVAMDEGSLSLSECIQTPALCDGNELYLGYATVTGAAPGTVSLKSWMGPVSIAPWPGSTPLPSPGASVSVVGHYGGGYTVVPNAVRTHRFRRIKERTGAVMALGWLVVLGGWARARWRDREESGA